MAICAAPIKGTHIKVVKVDACGAPVTGATSLVVTTKGFVQVVMDPQYEDGQEFFERNADGQPCVNQKDPPILKRHQLTIDLCEVDPVMAAYVLSARLLDTASPATTGTGWAQPSGQPTNRFSLEVWQRVAGSGGCDPSGQQRYIYHAWPNVGNVQVGSYTVENGRSTLQFIAETADPSLNWGNGPGSGTSWLPVGTTVLSTEHWLWNITTNPPPLESCGPTTLT